MNEIALFVLKNRISSAGQKQRQKSSLPSWAQHRLPFLLDVSWQ